MASKCTRTRFSDNIETHRLGFHTRVLKLLHLHRELWEWSHRRGLRETSTHTHTHTHTHPTRGKKHCDIHPGSYTNFRFKVGASDFKP